MTTGQIARYKTGQIKNSQHIPVFGVATTRPNRIQFPHYRISGFLFMLEVSNLACSRGDHRLFSELNFSSDPGQVMPWQTALTDIDLFAQPQLQAKK